MMRRIVVLCVVAGLVLALGLAPAAAKGRCRSVADPERFCGGARPLPSAVCHREGKRCNRSGDTCETLVVELDCGTDGDPGTVTVGMGCFCGGGTVSIERDNPVSVDEFFNLLETLEYSDVDAESCEAPPELEAIRLSVPVVPEDHSAEGE